MIKFFIFISFIITNYSFAGGAHFHPKRVADCKISKSCTKDEIKSAVNDGIKALLKWGKINKKFDGAPVSSVELKTFKKKGKTLTVWVADVSLKTEKGIDSQFVFFTQAGKVFRANITGELK